MNRMPGKIFALLGLESGLFVGLGIILFHTARIVRAASANGGWDSLRALDPTMGTKKERSAK